MGRNNLLFSSFPRREWAILSLFFLLTLIMLYPLSLNLTNMVPEPTDPLLNAWRMQWNAHAFLSGPAAVANIFNTNIFYPFPLTLAYSEHFLMLSALALPFLLLPDSHLVGMNLSVLVTFVLSGYAMYLLVTAWTGRRWAGFVAGVLFAFSPHRFGQLNHLELLVTPWMPLAILALHWTLTRPGLRYPVLFSLFFILQALSGFHFSLNLTIACILLALVYALTGRVYWRWGLGAAAVLSILVTLLINWPVWQMYLRFSDSMGAIRTPGEVRIYSAAFTDYLTAIPHNLLYGWTFGRWQMADHQFQPLMPFGLVGLCLALAGLILNFRRLYKTADSEWRIPHPTSSIKSYAFPLTLFLSLLTLISLLLSFGLNEEALGPNLVPLLEASPYRWLYANVAIFQGIRVPGRFGILVVIGLVGLAGWGAAALLRTSAKPPLGTHHISRIRHSILISGLVALILLESWSAPLVGPEIPAGPQLAPVYHWLQTETSPDTVVLELPFQGPSEFLYEYYSSHHWRRLANGGTGFTPPIYREMRQWFKTFPDPRSVDVIQQLGIDYIILHSTAYEAEAWQRLLADLPLYLPAFAQINQFGDDLVLHVAKPLCHSQADQVSATFTPTAGPDGLSNAVQITYHNEGPAAFVADVGQVSHLTFEEDDKNFTEPLVTPAGEVQSVLAPLPNQQPAARLTGAWLASLNRTVPAAELTSEVSNTSAYMEAPLPAGEAQWQPLGFNFSGGPQLVAYYLSQEAPTACSQLTLALKWAGGQPGDKITVQLLDPFGRVVVERVAQPGLEPDREIVDIRTLPLPGSVPAGRYGLRVYVYSAEGQERLPVTEAGVTIPTDQIPPLPLIIHPAPVTLPEHGGATQPLVGQAIRLRGGQLPQTEVAAGDWLRFILVWQAEQPLDTDLTVFTQLLGPDGQVWGQHDNQPKGGWYGTSLWLPGKPVTDDYVFQIDPAAPAGEYRLIAGMYDNTTLHRLPVQTAGGASGDFIEIGTVRVSNE